MAGAGMSLSIDGLVEVQRDLSLLLDRLGDLTPLMDILGMEIEVDIEENFDGEHSPAGIPWDKSQRAIATGGKTLTDSRRLRGSITHVASRTRVEAGTNVVYARRHNDGWSSVEQVASHKRVMREVFGVTLAEPITVTVKAHRRKASTPQRQFIGLSSDGMEGVRGHVADYLGAEQ
ncbi:phage virion morphogenesis protein [Sphingobium sp. WTD-1]|uniref:phage virion morphogenesis protein n=1 Tax=Sphingobium sp. WTD-1 TaxID=2979467 RepID=UPI0024DE77EF|nr:phage virion morphogenesis protein [Sphingobium sp. WTD-1]WIA55478.1 phage virion morphogenesis protein [Sphingobium sp. WTD-1]WIA56585.1 phage virion morphogenesis protein [Sphingobium sp. WTD-1]